MVLQTDMLSRERVRVHISPDAADVSEAVARVISKLVQERSAQGALLCSLLLIAFQTQLSPALLLIAFQTQLSPALLLIL